RAIAPRRCGQVAPAAGLGTHSSDRLPTSPASGADHRDHPGLGGGGPADDRPTRVHVAAVRCRRRPGSRPRGLADRRLRGGVRAPFGWLPPLSADGWLLFATYSLRLAAYGFV